MSGEASMPPLHASTCKHASICQLHARVCQQASRCTQAHVSMQGYVRYVQGCVSRPPTACKHMSAHKGMSFASKSVSAGIP
eukprot:1150545-Pelagomonas_calceolata.AAC.6